MIGAIDAFGPNGPNGANGVSSAIGVSSATGVSSAIGLDLGSRRSKVVSINNGQVVDHEVFQAWAFDRKSIIRWVDERRPQIGRNSIPLCVTGYSRHVAAAKLGGIAITEIRAFGLGSGVLGQGVKTLVDIGGQDAKAMILAPGGLVDNFEMNDRCAAGTGKFFELLATTLGVEFGELAQLAIQSADAVPISSTCAVFAESEIVGRLAEGVAPGLLARGVFRAVAERLAGMLRRIGFREPAFLVGGGANECLAEELGKILGIPFNTHSEGHLLGAIGAARHAERVTLTSQIVEPIPERPSLEDKNDRT